MDEVLDTGIATAQMNTSSLFSWTTQQKVSNTFYTPPNLLIIFLWHSDNNNDCQIYYQHFTNAFSKEDHDKIIAPRRKKRISRVLPSGITEPVLATLWASVLNPANVSLETCQLTIMVVTESHTSTSTDDMLNIYIYVQIMAHCTKAVLRR